MHNNYLPSYPPMQYAPSSAMPMPNNYPPMGASYSMPFIYNPQCDPNNVNQRWRTN